MNAKNENKVLACVDSSAYAEPIADYAAWAARQLSAPLELLHVIDRHAEQSAADHSGAIGFNAQEELLAQLSDQDETEARHAKQLGRELLGRLRMRALQAGAAEVDVRLRHGSLAETLTEQEGDVRLIVMGRRGESAAQLSQDLGQHVEHTVRHLRKPILLTVERFTPPQRVMFAFDGSAVTRRGIKTIAASPLLRGMPIHLLMAGKAAGRAPQQIQWATQKLTQAGFEVTSELCSEATSPAVAQAIAARAIDLLVMGSYSHSRWRNMFVGSQTNGLLRSTRIPTLLVR